MNDGFGELFPAAPDNAQSFHTTSPDEWQAHVCEVFTQISLENVNGAYFTAGATEQQAGSLHLADIVAGGQSVHRGKRQIEKCQADHCYLVVQKNGRCVVSSDQYDPIELVEGDAVLVDAQRPFVLDFKAPSNQLCLTLPNDELHHFAPNIGKSFAGHRIDGSKSVSRVLAAAIEDLRITATNAPTEVTMCTDLLYQVLMGCFRREQSKLTTEKMSRHASSFNMLLLFIADNHHLPGLSATKVADELGVSARTLHRLCYNHGTTFRKLVLNSRLMAAAHALRQFDSGADATITEIAFNCGFSDLSHFSRAFKSKFGAPPSTYLKGATN